MKSPCNHIWEPSPTTGFTECIECGLSHREYLANNCSPEKCLIPVVCPDCKNTYYGDRCIICYPTVVPANMGDALQKGALNKVVDKYHKDTIGLCSIVEFLDAYPIKSALCFDITQHECQDLAEEILYLLKRHC